MKLVQKIKCGIGMHKSGQLQPAVGGRNVKRCVHCEKILEEESIMNQVHLPRAQLPKGKQSDSWFKGRK